ncbi:MAG TPA: thrombospondin type 3 repeat-containing protein [Verrucomicrobiae bacterium]|jgi:hypothetical protein
MKTYLIGLLAFAHASSAWAATTINSVNKFAYGANLGWMDWRGDTNNGAVIGDFVCSGFIYAANVGWIHLGGNAPANGIRYLNNSATDYGVNHDGKGNLSGYAYGANIGWVSFTNNTATGALSATDVPQVDLKTGRLSGFAYSANCGWISLSNAFAFVQTDTISFTDSDGDGISDNWERLHFPNLTTATASTDSDGDGQTDKQEYFADTDPLNAQDFLRITNVTLNVAGNLTTISWPSKETRCYQVLERTDLLTGSYTNSGLGLFTPDAGSSTSRNVSDGVTSNRFFKVEAKRPLVP